MGKRMARRFKGTLTRSADPPGPLGAVLTRGTELVPITCDLRTGRLLRGSRGAACAVLVHPEMGDRAPWVPPWRQGPVRETLSRLECCFPSAGCRLRRERFIVIVPISNGMRKVGAARTASVPLDVTNPLPPAFCLGRPVGLGGPPGPLLPPKLPARCHLPTRASSFGSSADSVPVRT